MPRSTAPPAHLGRFLKPELLSRLGTLELVARTVVEGFLAGLHRSPFLGFSVDFAEYRQYIPGDDVRRIDWKVYARSDRYYIKQYEGETNTFVYLLLDVSASMSYASTSTSKIEYASFLAASLAYFAQHQKDSVGLVTFAEKILNKIPPRSRMGHLARILHALDAVNPQSQTKFCKPLTAVAESLHRRGIIVLISDLLAPLDEIMRGLHQFRHQGNDLVVFHIVDPQEKAFSFDGPRLFQDLETNQTVSFAPEVGRAEYLKRWGEHSNSIKQKCGALGIDYLQLETTEPLDLALQKYLITRRKSM
ncbi:MAG: DUF58 domain-containing protein [Terriglobia bacterium]